MDGNENLPVQQPPQPDAELLKQQDEHQYDIARRNIDATLQNNREIRGHFDKINLRSVLLVGFIVLCMLIFGLAALYLDKEDILADLLKILCGLLGGSGIGYALGSRKRPPDA